MYDGLPLDGVAVAIGADGRVRIGGPMLFDGYDGRPGAHRARCCVDGWFLTSDAGRLDEDGRLQVLGRVDDVVVSGGVNVPAGGGRRPAARAPGGARGRGASACPTPSGASGWSPWCVGRRPRRSTRPRDWVGGRAPARLGAARAWSSSTTLPLLRQRQGRPAAPCERLARG